MTDEQINQLFDLKQKLDAGIITKEAFDKEVSVLKGEKQPDVSQEEYSPEKEDKLAQLDELYNDGLITMEEMNKLQNEIVNGKPQEHYLGENTPQKSTNWMIFVGVGLLVAIIIVMAIATSNKSTVETTDSEYVEIPDKQQPEPTEPVYIEPEWTPSCGEWEMDQNSVLLRLRYNKQPVFVRYYPGDRFELSAPDLGMNDWCFKIKDSDGNKVNIVTSTQHHIQGSERVEIDDPASVKKLYKLLERGNFTIQPAWLIDVKVGNEGCGLAEFVWHKFTEQDPYTNEILGKSSSGDYSRTGSRVYDNDPTNGLGSDEALELIIRSELGDEDASQQLEDAINQELQRVITQ